MALCKYILKKLLLLIPVLIGVSIVAFALGALAPGDPVDQILNPDGGQDYTQEQYDAVAARLGLDQPVWVQYLSWLKDLLRGDFGRSFFTQKSILTQLQRRIPISAALAGLSMALTVVLGVGAGLLMAIFRDSPLDRALGALSTLLLSVPGFWIAIVLIFLFAEQWKLLPTSGILSFSGYILPSVTLALPSIGVCARLSRSAILDEIGRQYITVANSKGLTFRRVVFSHAFINALIPIATYLGTHLAGILGGASVIETIFAVPGVGSYAIAAVQSKDYYVVQAYVLFCGCVYVTVNLLIDLFYILINPRIRVGEAVG